MATTRYSPTDVQPPVGVPCELPLDRLDAAITLLRVIEQLPALSDPAGLSPDYALRLLAAVHANHLHLAEQARALLIPHPERVGLKTKPREVESPQPWRKRS